MGPGMGRTKGCRVDGFWRSCFFCFPTKNKLQCKLQLESLARVERQVCGQLFFGTFPVPPGQLWLTCANDTEFEANNWVQRYAEATAAPRSCGIGGRRVGHFWLTVMEGAF